jgi:hypothetical protein
MYPEFTRPLATKYVSIFNIERLAPASSRNFEERRVEIP